MIIRNGQAERLADHVFAAARKKPLAAALAPRQNSLILAESEAIA